MSSLKMKWKFFVQLQGDGKPHCQHANLCHSGQTPLPPSQHRHETRKCKPNSKKSGFPAFTVNWDKKIYFRKQLIYEESLSRKWTYRPKRFSLFRLSEKAVWPVVAQILTSIPTEGMVVFTWVELGWSAVTMKTPAKFELSFNGQYLKYWVSVIQTCPDFGHQASFQTVGILNVLD